MRNNVLILVNAMHITASVFINDDERGLHQDYVDTLTVHRNGRLISINVSVSAGGASVEVRLFSDANRAIFEYSDVSPHMPSSLRSQAAEIFDVEWARQEEAKRQDGKDEREAWERVPVKIIGE